MHETSLASPETVDLGGRCVLPGFTDSHVHFPTWAVAQHEVKLDGCTSLDEALARIRDARRARQPGCAATAGATATGPTAAARRATTSTRSRATGPPR